MATKKKRVRELKKRLVAILCLVLVVLLIGTSVFYYFATGFAEAEGAARPRYEIDMDYKEDDQALLIRQRLIYPNKTGRALDRVAFALGANAFRRESALFYDNAELTAGFPAGYAPGGAAFSAVRVNGKDALWGANGENELYLWVMADIAPGEAAEFEFEYTLLLTENRAFCGAWDTDVRLSAFYPAACVYDGEEDEFVQTSPLSFTRWLYAQRGDYRVSVTLPERCMAAGTGKETAADNGDGTITHTFLAEDVSEFSLSFSKKWRSEARQTASGTALRALGNLRGGNGRALDAAEAALNLLETWFGALPLGSVDLIQSDCAVGGTTYPGALWLPEALFSEGDALEHAIYAGLARQYFGLASAARPVQDAWLSDSVSEYLAYLIQEELAGRDAFLAALNAQVLPSLSVTVPGALYVSSDASLFSRSDFQTVVLDRGAAVFHELRSAMGWDALLAGLKNFYEAGLDGHALTEAELVAALDAMGGGSWSAFLTDWLFNISDYTREDLPWYE